MTDRMICFPLVLLGAVCCVPVMCQGLFRQTDGQMPTGFGSPFSLPLQFGKMTAGSFPSNGIGDQPSFTFPAQQPAPSPRQPAKAGDSMSHAYPVGTKGGDYPSRLAEKQGKDKSKPHAYPVGTDGGDYPTRLAQKQAGSQSEPYSDGTKGGDYPSQLAQKQQTSSQFPGNQFVPQRSPGSNSFSGSGGQQAQTPPMYPSGSKGGDYPSKLKEQQQSRNQFPSNQFLPQRPSESNKFSASSDQQAQTPHKYPRGITGGDYPSKLAEQQQQGQQQNVFAAHQTGVQNPHVQQQPQNRNQFGSFPTVSTGFQPTNTRSTSSQHAYPNEATGGDYPSHLASQQQKQPVAPSDGGRQAFAVGGSSQVPVNLARQFIPSPPQMSAPHSSLGNGQVFPSMSRQNQLFSPVRATADTNRGTFPGPHSAPQPHSSGSSGQHAYPVDTTGGDYPTRLKQQGNKGTATRPVPQASSPAGNPFGLSQSAPVIQGQCLPLQDMSAGYQLSGEAADYPVDAIVSELRSMPHIAAMVGFESLPEPAKPKSPFDSFGGFPSFGLQSTAPKPAQMLSNLKHFPGSADANLLSEAMNPLDKACPAQDSMLHALTMENNRCHVVNPDYQDITFSKCLRRDCQQCGASLGGLKACVERYNWVTTIVYCPHWPNGQRVSAVKLYLPQGCSCNRFAC